MSCSHFSHMERRKPVDFPPPMSKVWVSCSRLGPDRTRRNHSEAGGSSICWTLLPADPPGSSLASPPRPPPLVPPVSVQLKVTHQTGSLSSTSRWSESRSKLFFRLVVSGEASYLCRHADGETAAGVRSGNRNASVLCFSSNCEMRFFFFYVALTTF